MLEILNIKVVDEEAQDDIDRQMVMVNDLISHHFSSLTVPEIKEAMRMYVAKKFCDVKVFRLIDCVSIGEILSSYIEFRNQAIEPFLMKRQNLLIASIEKSTEEKLKIRNEFLLIVFNEIKENGFSDSAYHLFLDLEKEGKISISDDEKRKLYQQEFQKYVPAEKESIRIRGGISTKTLLNDFQKRIDSGKPLRYVKNRCRSIVVSNFLKDKTSDFETFKKLLENI